MTDNLDNLEYQQCDICDANINISEYNQHLLACLRRTQITNLIFRNREAAAAEDNQMCRMGSVVAAAVVEANAVAEAEEADENIVVANAVATEAAVANTVANNVWRRSIVSQAAVPTEVAEAIDIPSHMHTSTLNSTLAGTHTPRVDIHPNAIINVHEDAEVNIHGYLNIHGTDFESGYDEAWDYGGDYGDDLDLNDDEDENEDEDEDEDISDLNHRLDIQRFSSYITSNSQIRGLSMYDFISQHFNGINSPPSQISPLLLSVSNTTLGARAGSGGNRIGMMTGEDNNERNIIIPRHGFEVGLNADDFKKVSYSSTDKDELVLAEDDICPICQENLIETTNKNIKVTILACTHTYCETCILKWLLKSKKCPICMVNLKEKIC